MAPFVGRILGAYRLVERVGRGWLAEVYRAEHQQLGREAAVKVLAGYLAGDAGFLRRFKQEATSAATLDHPHILPIWDYGEQDGLAYVVAPFIRGGSLQDRLRQDSLSDTQAIVYLRQLAQALDYAHGRGVIHGGVRPANILVHERDHLYLIDFGIAAALADALAPVAGDLASVDPAYLAPEQVRGQGDSRSDLYSLGIIAYELLAGLVPFRGSTPVETLAMQLDEQPPLAPLHHRTPALPVGLPAVLERALFKDPAARYQSGVEFVEALATHLPVTATRPASLPGGLSAREVEVLRLVAAGLTKAQAADRLSLSARTINAHLTSIYGKLGVPSRAAAIRIAIEHNLS